MIPDNLLYVISRIIHMNKSNLNMAITSCTSTSVKKRVMDSIKPFTRFDWLTVRYKKADDLDQEKFFVLRPLKAY